MSTEFSLGEIAGGLIWLASGVAVAGYTFDAFKRSYSQFPAVGGTGPNIPPAPAAGFQSPQNPARKFGPGVAAGRTVPGTNAPSPGYIPGKRQNSDPQGITGGRFRQQVAPPGNLSNQLRLAVQARDPRKTLTVYYAIQDWGARNGVARVQLANWFAKQPYYARLVSLLPQTAGIG